MPLLVEPLSSAAEYTVQPGETLEQIVLKDEFTGPYPGVTWQIVARYNWGTVEPREVIRMMAESVGVEAADFGNTALRGTPEKIKFAPDGDVSQKIKIPKIWKAEGLEVEKTHVVKVKRHHPPNAISIEKLDKWFIPEQEACDIGWQLEGEGQYADKVQCDVYGSNYCECTAWNNGMGTYGAVLAEVPVYTKALPGQSTARGAFVMPDDGWKGEATAASGMLSRKTGTKTNRYINVAFSPYTVQFRYAKGDNDKDARLGLEAFWPQWEEKPTTPAATPTVAGDIKVAWTNAADADRGTLLVKDKDGQVVYFADLSVDQLKSGAKEITWDKKYRGGAINSDFKKEYLDDSGAVLPKTPQNAPYTYEIKTYKLELKTGDPDPLKIKWELKSAADLEFGLLKITDKDDKLVFLKALPKAKVANGKWDHVWDGKYSKDIKNSKDGDKIIPEDMPYRVQIQAHRGLDKDNGLALAATHTEVRLYVDPKTYPLTAEDHFSKETDAAADPQSIDLTLAPLYLGDNAPADKGKVEWTQYKLAEAGFHAGPVDGESRPELTTALKEFQRSVPKHKTGVKYERQTIDGTVSDESKTALENLPARYRRPWFGVSASKDDQAQATEEDLKAISKIIGKNDQELIVWVDWRHSYTQSRRDQSYVKVDEYRGPMSKGDAMVTDDETILCRPWIPLRADLQLLPKASALDATVARPTDDAQLEKMRQAVGPLRVDWSFVELPPDLEPVETTPHKKERVRTRRYVQWALREKRAQHEHKSPKRKVVLNNAKVENGGVRPDGGGATYFKQVFGHEAKKRLRPWHAMPSDTTESIATVVHDHLVATQPKDDEPLDKKNLGFAGVFFRPSTIAGDGYQVRAQVRFEKLAGSYEFPNADVLKARYWRVPQANSAGFRVWRKSSYRGTLAWGSATAHFDGIKDAYAPAHVHFVHEGGTPATYTATQLITGTELATYKALVAGLCTQACNKDQAKMDLTDNYSYPWADRDGLGWVWASPPDIPFNEVTAKLVTEVETSTWALFQEQLLLYATQRIEEIDGRLRGHVLASFKGTRDVYARRYRCQSCAKHFWYLEKDNAGQSAVGRKCESCNKTGDRGIQLDGKCKGRYRCSQCNQIANVTDAQERYPNGGAYTGGTGGCGHAGKLTFVSKTETQAPSAPKKTRDIINYGIGDAGGVIWVPHGMAGWEWAHEVGHNRHLEHSATAPVGTRTAERLKLHDSEFNDIVEWKRVEDKCEGCGNVETVAVGGSSDCSVCTGTLKVNSHTDECSDGTCGQREVRGPNDAVDACPACAGPMAAVEVEVECVGCKKSEWRHSSKPLTAACPDCGSTRMTAQPERAPTGDEQWDRACVMSYVDACATYDPGEDITYFCGKCVLRSRGWKVENITGGPGEKETVP